MIKNKVINIVEKALDTKVTGIHMNYVKEHDFNETETPKNSKEIIYIPVFTIETEIKIDDEIDEGELLLKEKALEEGVKELHRNVLIFIR